MHVAVKDNAFGFHLLDAALDDALFHLEVGNAVAQQPAGEGMLVVDVYLVTGARQLLRRRQARRPGTDDRNLLAGLLLGRLGRNPALGKGLVGDAAFDGLDRHRLVVDVERAGGLTWRRTDAAGNLGKIVGRVQIARRRPPLLAVDQIVPVRDLIVYGT